MLRDADSPYTLDSLAGALAETVNWLSTKNGDARRTYTTHKTPGHTASGAFSFPFTSDQK